MKTFIVLLRGINVGGNNIIPMKALKEMLSEAGYQDVLTYIQSGNIILKAKESDGGTVAKNIANLIATYFGFDIRVHALDRESFLKTIDQNPYGDLNDQGKNLHFGFLSELPLEADLESLNRISKETESFQIIGKVFYLYAPDGVGRSKLAAQSEKYLKVASKTDRNLATVLKLKAMLETD